MTQLPKKPPVWLYLLQMIARPDTEPLWPLLSAVKSLEPKPLPASSTKNSQTTPLCSTCSCRQFAAPSQFEKKIRLAPSNRSSLLGHTKPGSKAVCFRSTFAEWRTCSQETATNPPKSFERSWIVPASC